MDQPNRLAPALSERYRLERQLGEGGMATVYLAHDLKHDRKVAIKVLKPELAAVLGAERFVAEIKTTAALQHPNILPLFDSGEADGFLYYVMPYVEGETLRAKLNRETQLGVDEAVKLTTEVADALQYAHEQGVVHRDIKPENVLLHAGRPMVADFGIALAVSAAAGGRMTETGLSLGTPHYMSPEQATAEKTITNRSDIYSLAAVLYELLTGQPPHTGASAQQVIARIVSEDAVPVGTLRKSVPPNVAAALGKALEKVPADRFESAKTFAEALANPVFRVAPGVGAGVGSASAAGFAGWRWRLRDPFSVGVSVVAVAAIAVALLGRRASPAASALPPIRFVLSTTDSVKPLDEDVWAGAISPDGGTVVYAAVGQDSVHLLYSLRTDELEAHPIHGTAGAYQPYFSPDGTWLAFEQNGEERKVRLDGGSPVTITGGGVHGNGAAWTAGGQIVIGAHGSLRGLSQVSAGGGTPSVLTRVDSAQGEGEHVWPIATPDPNVVVFTIWSGGLLSSKLAAASLDDGHVTPLDVAGVRPLGVVDGHLVYVQADGSVMAVPFDVRRERVTGAAVPVHDAVNVHQAGNGSSDIYLSTAGGLITGNANSSGRLVWRDRDGTTLPAVPGARRCVWTAASPEARRIAAVVADHQGSDVYIWDGAPSTFSRLTTVGTVSWVGWTPDGSGVLYVTEDASGFAVWSETVTGVSPPRKLFAEPVRTYDAALSPDGASLLVTAGQGTWDILRVPLDSGVGARPYVANRFMEFLPRISPDGNWVAYLSNETGQTEVYVSSFPNPSEKILISAGRSAGLQWSRDGRRLYYLSYAGSHPTLLGARVSLSPTFRLLGRDTVASLPDLANPFWGLSPDGTPVLDVEPVSNAYRLVVSPNWITELHRRLAGSEGSRKP